MADVTDTGLCIRYRCPIKDNCCVVNAKDCLSYCASEDRLEYKAEDNLGPTRTYS